MEIETVPMFPAARVLMEPIIEEKKTIYPHWVFDTNNCPEWVVEPPRQWTDFDETYANETMWEDSSEHVEYSSAVMFISVLYESLIKDRFWFFGMPIKGRTSIHHIWAEQGGGPDGNDRIVERNEVFVIEPENEEHIRTVSEIGYGQSGGFTYDKALKRNKAQTVAVPAGVKLRVAVVVSDGVESKWAPVIIDKIVEARQGEEVNLGRAELRRRIPVIVKVVSSNGEPVEGVGVRYQADGGQRGITYYTDENGLVHFNVRPDTTGKFSVTSKIDYGWNTAFERPNGDRNEKPIEESIRYQVRGEEDSNKEFVLKISDELSQRILKQVDR
jgi:hypothetical protein